MAVKRIPRKNKFFEYDDIKYALRQPTVDEVMEITRRLAAYSRTLRDEVVEAKKDDVLDNISIVGDVTKMTEVQKYVTELLVVDADTNEQQFGPGPDQDKIETVPGDFIKAAWFCYSSQVAETKSDTPLEPPAIAETTTSASAEASSTSQSTSTSIPENATNGSGGSS